MEWHLGTQLYECDICLRSLSRKNICEIIFNNILEKQRVTFVIYAVKLFQDSHFYEHMWEHIYSNTIAGAPLREAFFWGFLLRGGGGVPSK